MGRTVTVPGEGGLVAPGQRATHLLDVSRDAARVRAGSLRTGDRVALAVDGFLPFRATVAWTTKEEAGLEFERPLHPSMVHHLARLTPRAG